MRYLPPLYLKERYVAPVESEIMRLLRETVYNPLLLAIGEEEITNSLSALLNAIRQGLVWYLDGRFYGTYSASISKELKLLGAEYDSFRKSWKLNPELVPAQVSFAVASARDRADKMRQSMLTEINYIDLNKIMDLSDTPEQYARTVDMMEQSFQYSVASISIAPKLTASQRDIIAREWGENLNLYIKGWADETILKLREEIQPHTLAGGRAQGLIKMLQDSYGASKSHATFLAHQETSMLMAKFRETRYTALGLEEYKWSTSHDSRVRHDHRELNGEIFRYDSPPVTNKKTGARNNPGEDYGCRCTAIALVR